MGYFYFREVLKLEKLNCIKCLKRWWFWGLHIHTKTKIHIFLICTQSFFKYVSFQPCPWLIWVNPNGFWMSRNEQVTFEESSINQMEYVLEIAIFHLGDQKRDQKMFPEYQIQSKQNCVKKCARFIQSVVSNTGYKKTYCGWLTN